MYQGKHKCETLKSIRKQIADANEIPYEPVVCTHKGDCLGTCPACESEMRYIENQLNIRKMAGKAVKIVGLATVMTLASSVAASNETENTNRGDSMTISASDTDDDDLMGIIVERRPEFPGGQKALMEFLKSNLIYPKVARDSSIQGRVIVKFTVEKDGTITDVEVVRGVHPALDEEAVRVVSMMPKWKPGTQMGDIVRTKFTLPVLFKINQEESKK